MGRTSRNEANREYNVKEGTLSERKHITRTQFYISSNSHFLFGTLEWEWKKPAVTARNGSCDCVVNVAASSHRRRGVRNGSMVSVDRWSMIPSTTTSGFFFLRQVWWWASNVHFAWNMNNLEGKRLNTKSPTFDPRARLVPTSVDYFQGLMIHERQKLQTSQLPMWVQKLFFLHYR